MGKTNYQKIQESAFKKDRNLTQTTLQFTTIISGGGGQDGGGPSGQIDEDGGVEGENENEIVDLNYPYLNMMNLKKSRSYWKNLSNRYSPYSVVQEKKASIPTRIGLTKIEKRVLNTVPHAIRPGNQIPNDIRREDFEEEIIDGVKIFKCNLEPCVSSNKSFKRGSVLFQHIRTVHTEDRPWKCEYENCPHAEIGFKLKGDLNQHVIYVHTEDRPWKCEYENCPQAQIGFKLKSDLNQHVIYVHTEDRPWKCEYENCPHAEIGFKLKSDLDQHVLYVHTEERPWKCDYENCPQAEIGFKLESDLNQHVIYVHTEDRPWKCEYENCPQAQIGFKVKSDLDQHVLYVHTEERPWKCDYENCPQAEIGFKVKKHLTRHVITVHHDYRIFTCDFDSCEYKDKGFKCQSALTKHKIYFHGELREFKCVFDGCYYFEVGFKRKGTLVGHLKYYHSSIRPYSCSKCDYNFKTKSNLETHYKNKYGCQYEKMGEMTKLWVHIGQVNESIAFEYFKRNFSQFNVTEKDSFRSLDGLLRTAADGNLVFNDNGSKVMGCLEIKTLASDLEKDPKKVSLTRWRLNIGYKLLESSVYGINYEVLPAHFYYSQLVRELHVLDKEFVVLACFSHGKSPPETYSIFPALLQKSAMTKKYFQNHFGNENESQTE